MPETERTSADRFLRRALSDLFRVRPQISNPTSPKGTLRSVARAFTIVTLTAGRRLVHGGGTDVEDYATFRIGLSENAPVEQVDVDITISLRTLVDSEAKVSDSIRCEVQVPGAKYGEEGERRIYRSGPGGRSRVMPWCWKLSNSDRGFAELTF